MNPCPRKFMSPGAWRRFLVEHPNWRPPVTAPCSIGAAAVIVVGGGAVGAGIPATEWLSEPGSVGVGLGQFDPMSALGHGNGHGGDNPGHGGTPPGHGGDNPGHGHGHGGYDPGHGGTPVPEPSSAAVFLLAAVLVLLMRRVRVR